VSSPLVVGCEIRWNTVGGMGGGIAVDMFATPTIRDCDIHDNTAESGGGISVSAAGGVIENCTVTGNSATFGGGVAFLSGLGVEVTGTSVEFNSAVHSGGGIYASDSWFGVAGSTVADNECQGAGGAVWLLGSTATIVATEVVRNSADLAAGGILVDVTSLEVTSGEISGNGVGVTVLDPGRSTVDARYSWWGDLSGPFHPALNPGGLGDSVTDGVEFAPWSVVTGVAGSESPVPSSWSLIKSLYR
jgi:predicted outer membrane repeat protein